jgi:hypothetical protein
MELIAALKQELADLEMQVNGETISKAGAEDSIGDESGLPSEPEDVEPAAMPPLPSIDSGKTVMPSRKNGAIEDYLSMPKKRAM